MKAVIHFFKTLDPKRKAYINVFWGLCFLTVLELGFLELPFSQTVITILVCLASLAKAVVVGWVYMHLNHETKGLKVLLIFPLFVAFFYAVFLILDSKVSDTRHAHDYVGQPKRYFGQRKIADRKVDDFGNTVIEETVAAAAHSSSVSAASSSVAEEAQESSASSEGGAGASSSSLSSSSLSSEAAKN